MQATQQWLETAGADYASEEPRSGCALLANYSARYLEWGEGPPLVLVPGLAGGVGLVSRLANSLARHFRVVSYQPRGEDDCFALRRHFGLPELVQDLREFLDRLCLERPLLLGVSFGGVVALELAAQYRQCLSGLVVQGVDVRFEPTLLRYVAGQVLSRYPLPSNNAFVNQFLNLLFGGRQRNRAIFDFVSRQVWQTDQSVMAHRFQLAEGFDLTDKLERISTPTLLLHGEKDLLVSEHGLRELQARIPQARLCRLPAAGHLAFFTHPEEIAERVREFTLETNLVEV